jgi:DNA-binding winged helix-turn-helix (wHTH) protein/tetratricopeptide (TPR) repeat protein
MLGARYRFGIFELDPASRTLRAEGVELRLNGKPFELLLLLVRHAGHTVTREQAIAALWPDTRVHANSLAVASSSLRRVLHEAYPASDLIETVPRRGYRLKQSVVEIQAPDSATEGFATEGAPEPREIVGRSAELARLKALFTNASQGRGGLVFVSGEPGIGKTALLERSRWECEHAAPALLFGSGKCVEQKGATEAFAPVIQAVGELLCGSSRLSVAEALVSRSPHWCLHHVGDFSTYPAVKELQREGSTIEAPTLMRGLCDALCELAAHRPLLLVLEDLQWADAATLDLLRVLSSRLRRKRVLLIASFRAPNALATPPHLQDLVHRNDGDFTHLLHLARLNEADVRALIERNHPELNDNAELARVLWEKSEGLPLFVVRLLRAALEDGALLASDPELARAAMARVFSEVPASVTGFIRLQVLGLPERERALLDVASVIGEEFHTSTLARVLAVDESTIERDLESLENAWQLVIRLREEETFDGGLTLRYRFCHALVQAELYALLGVQRRIALHRRIGDVLDHSLRRLESGSRGDHGYEHRTQLELSYHLARARRFGEAVLALLRAGDYCDRRFAKREAIVYYERALALLPKTTGAEQSLFRLLIAQNMGWARFGLGEIELARAEFHQAGLCARLLEAKESAPDTRAALDRGFRYLDIEWEDPILQRPSAMLVDHDAGRAHVLRAEAYFGECAALSRAERYVELIEVARDLLTLARETCNERRHAEALAWLGAAQLELGQLTEAELAIEQCLALSTEVRHARALDLATYSRAALHALRGDLERAIADLEAVRQRTVLSHGAAMCLVELGDLRAKQGKIRRALACHEEASSLRRAARTPARVEAGWIYRELGHLERALELDRVALTATAGEPRKQRELSYSLAASYARIGDLRRARTLLETTSSPNALRDSLVIMQREWLARCEIHLAAREYDHVEQIAGRWYALAAGQSARDAMMRSLAYRAAAAFGNAQLEAALHHTDAALTIHRQHPQPLLALQLWRLCQHIETARGDALAADKAARAADTLFHAIDATVDGDTLRRAFHQSALGGARSLRDREASGYAEF